MCMHHTCTGYCHVIYALQDILFHYPPCEAGGEEEEEDGSGEGDGGGVKELEKKLLELRGVFLTLSDSLATITGPSSHTK